MIRILVNSAGLGHAGKLETQDVDQILNMIDVNCRALTAVTMTCLPYFRKGSRIIQLDSGSAFLPQPGFAAYAASKGGVAQLTKALSNEWAGKNININALAPGYMATALNTAIINDPVRSKEILDRIPARRWGQPEDMKGAVIFLASGASDYLNGAIIPVDGGFLSR